MLGRIRLRLPVLVRVALAVAALWALAPAAAQDDFYLEVEACADPERGPDHEDCVCSVLSRQDSEFWQVYQWESGGAEPERYPSGLRYEGDPGVPPEQRAPVRDK